MNRVIILSLVLASSTLIGCSAEMEKKETKKEESTALMTEPTMKKKELVASKSDAFRMKGCKYRW